MDIIEVDNSGLSHHSDNVAPVGFAPADETTKQPTTRHRKTLDETLAALPLERKVEIIKNLKAQVGEELAKVRAAAATAAEMAKDL